jgi:hypothetical protein
MATSWHSSHSKTTIFMPITPSSYFSGCAVFMVADSLSNASKCKNTWRLMRILFNFYFNGVYYVSH